LVESEKYRIFAAANLKIKFIMIKKINSKNVSTKPLNVPKNINRNGKNNMRFTKIDKK